MAGTGGEQPKPKGSGPPWQNGKAPNNKVATQREKALQKELDELRAQLSKDKDSEPDIGDSNSSDHEKVIKDCRRYLAKCKSRVAEAEQDEDQDSLSLWKPRQVKAEADLQQALDRQQAAKPLDQRQKELEKEAKRLEQNREKQHEANE